MYDEGEEMKVLYDHQIFQMENIGGISRYFAELLKYNPMLELSLKYSNNIYLQKKHFRDNNMLPKNYTFNTLFRNFNFKGKRHLVKYYTKLLNKSNLSMSIGNLKKSDYDIFHPTYYDPYFLPYLKGKPFVLTVHDMIHELFPSYFAKDKFTIAYKRKLVCSADKINVNSEQTKKDLIRVYPDVCEKITVVYHAFSFPIALTERVIGNYVLFTGSRIGYKNFINFVCAIAPLLLKYELRLVCTGQPFSTNELALLQDLNIIDKAVSVLASEDELIKLYARANVFVFPSLYEGFGIPVLEAFATGCPAILANAGSLPEIGANAAVYFDPYSIDDMRSQIDNVLGSPSLQSEMIRKGKERARYFSWEKCAKETIGVYKSILVSN